MSPRPIGYKHSAETRAKLSATRKGRPHSPLHRRNLGLAIKAAWARKRLPRDEVKRRDAIVKRRRTLRRYGLTLADYDAMLARQGGCCAICHRPPPSNESFCVDHDHNTKRVRALLCRYCNLVIGNARESPAILFAAARYITQHLEAVA